MSAKEDIFSRIAAAHRAAPPPDLPYEAIRRDYRTTSDLQGQALVELLVDRIVDYKAVVRQCTADTLCTTIAEALTARGVRSIAVPDGLDEDWLAEVEVEVVRDVAADRSPLLVDVLDAVDGVLTSCAVAVAETGTLILDGSADQGRRLISLIPDYHLCVVLPAAICADLPEAVARLDPIRPTTMISGPSATSDIELNRVEGVHGPRTLEVIVVGQFA